jgi:deoxyribose-phosphate aldolase
MPPTAVPPWERIAESCEYAFLRPDASQPELEAFLRLAGTLRPYAVVVPSSLAKELRPLLKGIRLVGVVGFPHGLEALEAKIAELDYLLLCGVDEVDFVPNPFYLRSMKMHEFNRELSAFRERASGIVLKAIVEVGTGEAELSAAIAGISQYGIDFLKLGTGFGPRAVTADDVRLAKRLGAGRIKAAGGIRGLKQALELLEAGADRLGLSRLELLRSEWEAAARSSSKG